MINRLLKSIMNFINIFVGLFIIVAVFSSLALFLFTIVAANMPMKVEHPKDYSNLYVNDYDYKKSQEIYKLSNDLYRDKVYDVAEKKYSFSDVKFVCFFRPQDTPFVKDSLAKMNYNYSALDDLKNKMIAPKTYKDMLAFIVKNDNSSFPLFFVNDKKFVDVEYAVAANGDFGQCINVKNGKISLIFMPEKNSDSWILKVD